MVWPEQSYEFAEEAGRKSNNGISLITHIFYIFSTYNEKKVFEYNLMIFYIMIEESNQYILAIENYYGVCSDALPFQRKRIFESRMSLH